MKNNYDNSVKHEANLLSIMSFNIEANFSPLHIWDIIISNHVTLLQETTFKSILSIHKLIHKNNKNIKIIYKSKKNSKTAIVINHEKNIEMVIKHENIVKINDCFIHNNKTIHSQNSQRVTDVVINIPKLRTNIHVINTYFPLGTDYISQQNLIDQLQNSIAAIPRRKTWKMIIAGDFNHILCQELDREKTPLTEKQSELDTAAKMNELTNQYNLIDVFRALHPTTKLFTNKNYNNNRRIDRFHIDRNLFNRVDSYKHKKWKNIKSTHTSIKIELLILGKTKTKMGKPRFSYKDYHIENKEFRDSIINDTLTDTWDEMVTEMKSISRKIKFSKKLPMESDINNEVFNDLNTRFSVKEKKKTVLFSKLSNDITNKTAETTEEILEMTREFMAGVYKRTTHQTKDYTTLAKFNKAITDWQKQELEKPLLLEELETQLKHTNINSAPGPDGINYRVIRALWLKLGPLLVKMGNTIMDTGKLPESQKLVIINLIPKKENRQQVNNLRPIAIMNCAIRLISAAINKRLQSHLSNIFHDNQHGFIPGRSISQVASKLDLVRQTIMSNPEEKITIGFLDFSKAFDSVSHRFIEETLHKFNLGPKITNFCMAITTEQHAKININNYLSADIPLETGVRQGNPLLPLIFNLCLEPLLHILDKKLKGVRVDGSIKVTSLSYADDVTVILHDTEINKLERILEKYRLESNLSINRKKCHILSNHEEAFLSLGFSHEPLSNSNSKYLGVPLNTNLLEEQILRTCQLISCYITDGLPTTLKAQGVNLYCYSRLYHSDILAGYTDTQLNQIQNKVQNLFQGTGSKNLLANRDQGGFGLLNIKTQIKAARGKQILHLLTDTSPHNWHIGIWRSQIQRFLEEAYPSEFNAEYKIVHWYDFLTNAANGAGKKIQSSNLLTTHQKNCLQLWFNQTKAERLTPYAKPKEFNEQLIKSLTDGYINPRFIPTKGNKLTFFNSRSKKHQRNLRKSLTPYTWTKEFKISKYKWKRFFKNLHQNILAKPYGLEPFHRWALGQYNHLVEEETTCRLCGEDFEEDMLSKIKHRFTLCPIRKRIWQLLGTHGARCEVEHIIGNYRLSQLQLLSIARFIKAITTLELKYTTDENYDLTEKQLHQWCHKFKYIYRKSYGF